MRRRNSWNRAFWALSREGSVSVLPARWRCHASCSWWLELGSSPRFCLGLEDHTHGDASGTRPRESGLQSWPHGWASSDSQRTLSLCQNLALRLSILPDLNCLKRTPSEGTLHHSLMSHEYHLRKKLVVSEYWGFPDGRHSATVWSCQSVVRSPILLDFALFCLPSVISINSCSSLLQHLHCLLQAA